MKIKRKNTSGALDIASVFFAYLISLMSVWIALLIDALHGFEFIEIERVMKEVQYVVSIEIIIFFYNLYGCVCLEINLILRVFISATRPQTGFVGW